MGKQVEVVAVLVAQPGKEASVEAVLTELAAASREEEGCIEYGFYRDRADATRVLAFEIWASSILKPNISRQGSVSSRACWLPNRSLHSARRLFRDLHGWPICVFLFGLRDPCKGNPRQG